MSVEIFLSAVGMAIAMFIVFELKGVIEKIVDGRVKKAEADARAEEAKLERIRLEQRQ
jgi:hypothetical protein